MSYALDCAYRFWHPLDFAFIYRQCTPPPPAHPHPSTQPTPSTPQVRVHDAARDIEWFWDKSKFINRVYLIRERYECFAAGEAPPGGEAEEDDPFWDPNEPAPVRCAGPWHALCVSPVGGRTASGVRAPPVAATSTSYWAVPGLVPSPGYQKVPEGSVCVDSANGP